MLNDFKKQLKRKGSKNFNFVKIRASRICSHCLKTLAVGTECLTVNPKRGTRRWYCCDCVQLRLNIVQAKSHLANVAFGDEGAYMAYSEWEYEAIAEWEEAGGI